MDKIKFTIEVTPEALQYLVRRCIDGGAFAGATEEDLVRRFASAMQPEELDDEPLEDVDPAEVSDALERGFQALRSLVDIWRDGFDPTGKAHWDEEAGETPRSGPNLSDLLFKLSTSRLNGNVLGYIQQCGGLTHAVLACLLDLSGEDTDETRDYARAIAVNIAQVGSIRFPEVTPLLEQHDPLSTPPKPAEVLHGVQ